MNMRNYSDVAAKSLDASNQNISSVLSQIKDDGPAYGEANKKRDNLVKLNAYKNQASAQRTDEASLLNSLEDELERELKTQSSVFSSGRFRKNTKIDKKQWAFYLILLFSVITIVFFMNQLDIRTNKVEMLLTEKNSDIPHTVQSDNEVSPTILKLNKALKNVKGELAKIKTMADTESTKQNNKSVIHDEIVSTLKDEIHILKVELKKANNKLKSNHVLPTNVNKTRVKQTTVKQIKIKKKAPVLRGVTTWRVNLLALSNKVKANALVKQLKRDGFKPSIEEVNVRGKRIYRLGVDGFSNKHQADLFVIIAEEQYAMKGGWIQKVKN